MTAPLVCKACGCGESGQATAWRVLQASNGETTVTHISPYGCVAALVRERETARQEAAATAYECAYELRRALSIIDGIPDLAPFAQTIRLDARKKGVAV